MLDFESLPLLTVADDPEIDMQRVVGCDCVRNGGEVYDRIIVHSTNKRRIRGGKVEEMTTLQSISLTPGPGAGIEPSRNRAPSTLFKGDTRRYIFHATASEDGRLVVFTEVSHAQAQFRTVAYLRDKGEIDIIPWSVWPYSCYFFKTHSPIFGEEWSVLLISDNDFKKINIETRRTGKEPLASRQRGNSMGCMWHQWNPVTRVLVLFTQEAHAWIFDYSRSDDPYMKYRLHGPEHWILQRTLVDNADVEIPLTYGFPNRSANFAMNFSFLEFYRETGEKDYILCQQKVPIIVRNQEGPPSNWDTLQVNIDVFRSLERLVLNIDLRPYVGDPDPTANKLYASMLEYNAYGFRANFFIISGVLCIAVPNVCVSYVDITHRKRPPRYLFTAGWPEKQRLSKRASLLPLQRHPMRPASAEDFDSVAVWFCPNTEFRSKKWKEQNPNISRLSMWTTKITKKRMWEWITHQLANRGSVKKIRRAMHIVTMHLPPDQTLPDDSPLNPGPSSATEHSLSGTDHSTQQYIDPNSATAQQQGPASASTTTAGGDFSSGRTLNVSMEAQEIEFLQYMFRNVSYRLLTSEVLVEYLLSSASRQWRTKHAAQAVPFDGECLKRSEELLLISFKNARFPPGFVPTLLDTHEDIVRGGLTLDTLNEGNAAADPSAPLPNIAASPGSPTSTVHPNVLRRGAPSFSSSAASPLNQSTTAGGSVIESRSEPTHNEPVQRNGSDPIPPASGNVPNGSQSHYNVSAATTTTFMTQPVAIVSSLRKEELIVQLDRRHTPFMMHPSDIDDWLLDSTEQIVVNPSRIRSFRGGNPSGLHLPRTMTASIALLANDSSTATSNIRGDSEYIHLTTEEFKRVMVGLPPGDAYRLATQYHKDMECAVLRVFKAMSAVFAKNKRKLFHVLHNLEHALTALSFPAPADVRYELTSLACELLPPEALVEGMRSGIYRATINPHSGSSGGIGSGFMDGMEQSGSTRGSAAGVSQSLAWGGHKDVVLGNALHLCHEDSITEKQSHYQLYHNLLLESTIHDNEKDGRHIRSEQISHDAVPGLQLMDDHLPKDCPVSAPAPMVDWYQHTKRGGSGGNSSSNRGGGTYSTTSTNSMENFGHDVMKRLFDPFSRWDAESDGTVLGQSEYGSNGNFSSRAAFERHTREVLHGDTVRRNQPTRHFFNYQ